MLVMYVLTSVMNVYKHMYAPELGARGGVTTQHHHLCNEQSISSIYWNVSCIYNHTYICTWAGRAMSASVLAERRCRRLHFSESEWRAFVWAVKLLCCILQSSRATLNFLVWLGVDVIPFSDLEIARIYVHTYIYANCMYLYTHICPAIFARHCQFLCVIRCTFHQVTSVYVHKHMRIMHLCTRMYERHLCAVLPMSLSH